MLDVTAFKKAIKSLNEALLEFDKTKSVFVKDACIQRFEYTYDLSHKMLKRQLAAMQAAQSDINLLSFQDLIRMGAQKGFLLNSWDVWSKHRHARNITSHAYDNNKAQEVFNDIPSFLVEAQYLLEQLEKLNS